MQLSRVHRRPVTKVLFIHISVKMKVCFVTCHNHKFGIFLEHLQHSLSESYSPAQSCWFNSWTINRLNGWKFKSWCKIRRTVVSDNLRAWAWRTADRRGLWSTAFRTASTFSGVLTVRLDTPCFFVAEAVVRKLCTQRSIVFRDGILPWRGTLKCRWNFFCVTITDSPFLKNVSTTNVRC